MRKLTVKVVLGLCLVTSMFTGFQSIVQAATYTVQPGDSLWAIARKFDTTVNDLKKFNRHRSDQVYVGQELDIPGTSWEYTVQPGDTLSEIAHRNGVSIKAIQEVNELTTELIRIGQKIIIPAGNSPFARRANLNEKELELLARVIYAEARGESYTGQIAVAAVLLNRMDSVYFPDTLEGVVYQKNAFETVSNGHINKQPNRMAYLAAQAALNGEDPTSGALYFYNPKTVQNPNSWIWTRRVTLKIGNHNFAV